MKTPLILMPVAVFRAVLSRLDTDHGGAIYKPLLEES